MSNMSSAIPERLSMITLGVRDVAASRAFYERLGFRAADFDSADVTFFQMNGTVLGLYGRDALAEDATVPSDGTGFRGVSLAINMDSEQEVDAALDHAVVCGATLVKPADKVFWGGYSGYFADPDGILWEIAFNPMWRNTEAGHMTLPNPATTD